jgi:hypothetical protein
MDLYSVQGRSQAYGRLGHGPGCRSKNFLEELCPLASAGLVSGFTESYVCVCIYIYVCVYPSGTVQASQAQDNTHASKSRLRPPTCVLQIYILG